MPTLVILAALAGAAAHASAVQWSLDLPPGEVAAIEITDADGARLARLLVEDGGTRRQGGWRPDLDPRPGLVTARLAALGLPPGDYEARIVRTEGTERRPLPVDLGAERLVAVHLPDAATHAEAWRWSDDGGNDGFAWARPGATSTDGGADATAWLPLDGPGWTVSVDGAVATEPEAAAARVMPQPVRPRIRTPDRRLEPWVRFGVLPMCALLAGLGLLGATRARRTNGLPLAALLGLVIGGIAVAPVLADPTAAVLWAGGGHDDPLDSIALLAAVDDGLHHLSNISSRFSFPEGASWLVTGPSVLWLMPAAAIGWLVGPALAHAAGVGLGLALLTVTAWALARELGADPLPALLAGVAAAFAPVVQGEIDVQSLDRASLFLVPLAVLLLHRALDRPGWILAAGAAIAANFYGQVYFGLYLAVACPFLVLPWLTSARRLARAIAIGAVALLMMAPGLGALRAGTADTRLGDDEPAAWTRPSPSEIVAADPKAGGHQAPTDTAHQRLVATTAHSLRPDQILRPGGALYAGVLFWPIALLAVGMARRRGALAAWYVSVFLVFSLGPFLRLTGGTLGPPLPYSLPFRFIGGFDQLKLVNRNMLLAASISGVPLALVIDAATRRWRPVATRLAVPTLAGVIAAAHVAPLAIGAQGARFVVEDNDGELLRWAWPHVTTGRFPLPRALADLPPGPAIALPLDEPTAPEIYLSAVRARLPLVNQPPYGMAMTTLHAPWFDANPLLNGLAWASGSDRVRRRMLSSRSNTGLAELRDAGLRYVILFRDLLSPILVAETERFADAVAPRVADDGSVVVWELAP